MFSIDDVKQAVSELMQGNNEPSVKLAFWYSALSTMQQLKRNCAVASLLRAYRDKPLPPREELYNQLRLSGAIVFTRHMDSLYYVEYLEKAGLLDGLEHIGTIYPAQVEWRDKVHALVKGHGLSWKTISFAALLLQPETCQLVPVDRHVLMRLGYNSKDSPGNRERYINIELHVMREQADSSYTDIPLSWFHWLKWEEYRQLVAKSSACNGTMESHKDLSCRM